MEQNANFDNNFFNDRASSIVIDGPCRWLFYQDHNFLGTTTLLTPRSYSSPPSFGGNGDRISSARAIPPLGTDAICLFEHGNYQGRMLVLYGSSPYLRLLDFNDRVSSVIITGGSWTLYEHRDYNGRTTTLSAGDYPNIHTLHIGGDTVTSVRCSGCIGSNTPWTEQHYFFVLSAVDKSV